MKSVAVLLILVLAATFIPLLAGLFLNSLWLTVLFTSAACAVLYFLVLRYNFATSRVVLAAALGGVAGGILFTSVVEDIVANVYDTSPMHIVVGRAVRNLGAPEGVLYIFGYAAMVLLPLLVVAFFLARSRRAV